MHSDLHPLDIERTLQELKSLREGLGMTQQQLAALMGVPRTYISKWENGVARPDYVHLVQLWRLIHGLRIEAEATQQ